MKSMILSKQLWDEFDDLYDSSFNISSNYRVPDIVTLKITDK